MSYDAITFRTDPEDCERCSEITDLPCDEHGLLQEYARLHEWREKTLPLIAALAIYGEGASLTALVEKARELNEHMEQMAEPVAVGEAGPHDDMPMFPG